MNGRRGLLIAGALLVLLLALAPLASNAPDGLEYTLEGYASASGETAAEAGAAPESAATVVLSGMAGAAIVLGLGWVWGAARKAR